MDACGVRLGRKTAYLAGVRMFQERQLASRMADLMLASILT